MCGAGSHLAAVSESWAGTFWQKGWLAVMLGKGWCRPRESVMYAI